MDEDKKFVVTCTEYGSIVTRYKYKTFFGALKNYVKQLRLGKGNPGWQVTLSNYISPYMVSQKKHGI